MVPAILVTLFCCLPLGIVAIINANKVNTMLAAGDYNGAVTASNQARQWTMWAAIAGVATWVIFGICWVVYLGAIIAASGSSNF
jgi:hypothetical protein